jgi:hypothetical protein
MVACNCGNRGVLARMRFGAPAAPGVSGARTPRGAKRALQQSPDDLGARSSPEAHTRTHASNQIAQAAATETVEATVEELNGRSSNGNGSGRAASSNGTSTSYVTVQLPAAGAAAAAAINGNGNGNGSSNSQQKRARILNTIDEDQNAVAAGKLELAAVTEGAADGGSAAPRSAAGTPYKNPGARRGGDMAFCGWHACVY